MVAQLNMAILGWVTRHPRSARVLILVALILALVLGGTLPAHADTSSPPPDSNNVLNGVTDSKGIPADKFEALPFDRGGLDNFEKLTNSWWINLFWSINTFGLKECLWLFQWTLSFEWVDVVTAPAQLLAKGIQSVMGEISIIPLGLTVTAIVCGLWIVRGKHATGWINLAVSILFAILATGVLANPVDTVVGKSGVIHTAANWGGEIAVHITNDGNPPAPGSGISDLINASVSQQLVDIFLRVPAQLVSFGKVLDGHCVTVFDNAMKAVTPGDGGDNSVRDAVSACDPQVKQFIDWPHDQLLTLVVVGFAMFLLFAFALALVMILFVTVVVAAYKAISLIWKSVIATFPGGDRGGVWYALFEVLTSAAIVAGSLVFLAAYLRFIIMYMKATAFMGLNQFVLVDVLFFAGIFLMWKFRKSLRRSAKKMAERLSRLGGASSVAPKDRRPVNPVQTAASLARTYADMRMLASRIPSRGPKSRPAAPAAAEKAAIAAPSQPQLALTGGNGSLALPAGSSGAAGPTPSTRERVRGIAAGTGRTALQIASFIPTPLGAAAKTAQMALNVSSVARKALPGGTGPKSLASGSTAPRSAPRGIAPTVRIVGSDVGPQTPPINARSSRNAALREEISARRAPKAIGS